MLWHETYVLRTKSWVREVIVCYTRRCGFVCIAVMSYYDRPLNNDYTTRINFTHVINHDSLRFNDLGTRLKRKAEARQGNLQPFVGPACTCFTGLSLCDMSLLYPVTHITTVRPQVSPEGSIFLRYLPSRFPPLVPLSPNLTHCLSFSTSALSRALTASLVESQKQQTTAPHNVCSKETREGECGLQTYSARRDELPLTRTRQELTKVTLSASLSPAPSQPKSITPKTPKRERKRLY